MFLVWWLVFKVAPFKSTPESFSALYRAMTLLVVVSPCALVLSIPSAILAAVAWGAKNGILFRGGAAVEKCSDGKHRIHRKGMPKAKAEKELTRLEEEKARDLKISKVVRCKIRYFKDGAVLGSRKFVNDFFESQRESFSKKRKDGARKARGTLKDLAGEIWTLRDLKDG